MKTSLACIFTVLTLLSPSIFNNGLHTNNIGKYTWADALLDIERSGGVKFIPADNNTVDEYDTNVRAWTWADALESMNQSVPFCQNILLDKLK